MRANKTLIILFIYHLLFVLMAYKYISIFGGDANLYWHHYTYSLNKSWFDFFNYGTDFILFLNYPLVKIGLPFFIGFLIYGTIGFFGILKWMQWSELVFGKKLMYKGINFLTLVFFLPNLHFWTATLGKEPIIFWGIASVMYAIATNSYKTFSFIVGGLAVLIIRPHIAFVFICDILLTFLFQKKYSLKNKIAAAVISSFLLTLFIYMTLQLSNIKYFNWERINNFNEYSIVSLKNSGSYVPMLNYNSGYRLFSFYFRPLFYDVKSVFTFFASIENLLIFGVHILSIYFILFYFKKIKFPQWTIIIFLFTIISGFIYIQRYANLGLFMRTKIMFQPFFIVVMLYIIKQGLYLNNSKSENE